MTGLPESPIRVKTVHRVAGIRRGHGRADTSRWTRLAAYAAGRIRRHERRRILRADMLARLEGGSEQKLSLMQVREPGLSGKEQGFSPGR